MCIRDRIQTAKHPWQGQVDIIPVERNRFVLTYGGSDQGSSHASVEEVKALLPMGAQVMAIELSLIHIFPVPAAMSSIRWWCWYASIDRRYAIGSASG